MEFFSADEGGVKREPGTLCVSPLRKGVFWDQLFLFRDQLFLLLSSYI